MDLLASFPPAMKKEIQEWLKPPYDKDTQEKLLNLLEKDPLAVQEAFCTRLEFGTGGIRGLMGIGPNRINPYTIQILTQAVSLYLLEKRYSAPLRVLIGFDSRHHSALFATHAARVLAANGIEALLLQECRPTPFVSFGIRHEKCTAGLMITASHNPPSYNGCKVYLEDGSQVLFPHDKAILEKMQTLTINDVLLVPLEHPSIRQVGKELDEKYLATLASFHTLSPQEKKHAPSLKITYTSLHGTGITLIPSALEQAGFHEYNLVFAQASLDGDFPTISSPNPQEPSALEEGKKQLLQTDSALLLATDADADRIGVVVQHKDDLFTLNGNEIAALCLEHICTTLKEKGALPPHAAVISTLVTTELLQKITTTFGLVHVEVLPGFKYIAEAIRQKEKEHIPFLFAAEESYGYLWGDHARDKDAVVLASLLCEVALKAKLQGVTLIDQLQHLYKQYGVFKEGDFSLEYPSTQEGYKIIENLMRHLRENPPCNFGDLPVLYKEDYESGQRFFFSNPPSKTPLALPRANILLFRLSDQSKIIIRPSGTEPKLKIYLSVQASSTLPLSEGLAYCERRLQDLTKEVKELLYDTTAPKTTADGRNSDRKKRDPRSPRIASAEGSS